MKSLLNPDDRNGLIERLKSLDVNNRRNWGNMSIHEVIPHLTEPLRAAIGEKSVPHQKSIFYDTLFGKGIVWFIPWPKGAPTAPEFLPGTGCTAPTEFIEDKQILIGAIDQFVKHHETANFQISPVFGKLSNKAWGRLMWRHVDHHLRQFSA